MTTFELLIIILVLLMFIVFIMILLIDHNKQKELIKELIHHNDDENLDRIETLKYEINKDLLQFQTSMINSLSTDLNSLNNTTNDRLFRIESRVNENLSRGFEKTNQSFMNILTEMAHINETQVKLNSLSEDIVSLQNVLLDKKTRGTFGEVQLYNILQSVYGNDEHFYAKQFKLSNGYIADSVIFAPDPLGKIVVDSKFPLENFNRLYDNLSNNELNKVKSEFRKDIKTHIKDISSKYLIENETAEIAFMFIPSEAIFAEIYGHYDDLIQYSYNNHVYIVSPTTLMAYITAFQAIYLGQKRNDKVKEIQVELIKLSKEFERYVERYQNLNKDFNKLAKDFELLNVTNDKLIARFNEIEQVKFENKDEISLD